MNVELIMLRMPEMPAVNSTIQTFENQLAKQLTTKQQYAQQRLEEYQRKLEANEYNTITKKEAENEILRLDQEITKFSQDSQQRIMEKRSQLMDPLTTKLQKAIDEAAAEGGFTFVLNQTINGVSNVLYAPDNANLNLVVMKKLGIQVPDGN